MSSEITNPPIEFQPDPFVRKIGDGLETLTCAVEGIRCGGCVRRIEDALAPIPGVVAVRANATTHRLRLVWRPEEVKPSQLLERVSELGFHPTPFDLDQTRENARREQDRLLIALGVAGFGVLNLMGFAYAVWAGLVLDMGGQTRTLMNWLSALVALPVAAVAGRPFYSSAWSALRNGKINMDGPISFAVIVTLGASVAQTIRGAEHVYYDAAVSLLFFLLIGRTLEAGIRRHAGSAVDNLLALSKGVVRKLLPNGGTIDVRDDELRVGDMVLVAKGARFPADGIVKSGICEVDESLITGESKLRLVETGGAVIAGTQNIGQAVQFLVKAVDKDTRLAEIAELMERAEQHRGSRQIMADRFAAYYAPAVLTLSLLGLLVWRFAIGADWPDAVMVAVAVLVVTCPCAVGLATPAVMVGTVARLIDKGIIVKSSDSIERLAEIDEVVFDKTGTLTVDRPQLVEPPGGYGKALKLAASLSANSTHPLSQALNAACPTTPAENIIEHPGLGLMKATRQGEIRLGSRRFCEIAEKLSLDQSADGKDEQDHQELWLTEPGKAPVRFIFTEKLRVDAETIINRLRNEGLKTSILSGDRAVAVARIAGKTGIENWTSDCQPEDKVDYLETRRSQGANVLMVGDGLNDAPALAAAHISMSPSAASDISRISADMVLQGDRLAPVAEAYEISRRSMTLVKQNLAFAILYNVVTVPIALAGALTPLIAALLMSSSSLLVMLNALRIRLVS